MSLEFREEGHVYTLDGRVLPSVTQVLAPYESWPGVAGEALWAARERGTRVHTACHLLLLGVLDPDTVDDEIAPYVSGFERFLAESGFEAQFSEHRVHSKLGYAGTLDLFGDLPRKKNALIDIKTGSVSRGAGPQTAAYAHALCEGGGPATNARYALLLTPGKYKLVPLDDPRDKQVFLAALTIHNWRMNHG